MPSTYTVNLGIEKPATGEQSGTWGDTTNTNFDILDQAINGAVRVTLTSAGTSGSPNQLQITNGAASDGRNKWIEIYSASDLGGSAYLQLDPNDAEKILFIRNSLAGSQSILLFQGTYDAARDLEVPAGVDMVVKFDGGGASAATVTDVYTKLRVTELTTPTLTATTADINGGTLDNSVIGGTTAAAITGTTIVANTSLNIAGDGATVTGIKDEDDMSSNSPTKLATQQSIKAYVDSQVGTVDTWAEVLANGATSGSTNPEVTAGQALKTNTINETSAGSGVTIDSVLLKDDVVNATDIEVSSISANDGTEAATLANSTGVMTIASSVLTTTDINAGTIDNTTIGGSTAAVGSFTLLNASSTIKGESSTGGFITLKRDDTTLTNNADVGAINFETTDTDDAGVASTILASGDGTGGGVKLRFYAGKASNKTERLTLYNSGVAVFNEDGNDFDFRIESDNNANMFYVNAGTDRVGVGTNTPDRKFTVSGTDTIIANFENTTAAGNGRIAVTTGSNTAYFTQFGQSHATTPNITQISAPSETRFVNSGVTVATMKSSGNTGFGTTNPQYRIHTEGSSAVQARLYRTNSTEGVGVGIDFAQNNDAAEETTLAQMFGVLVDNTDGTEDGKITFHIKQNGSITEKFSIDSAGAFVSDGGAVINEDSQDSDFRVESNSNSHMLFVNAGLDQVAIGSGTISAPSGYHLFSYGSGSGARSAFVHGAGDGGIVVSGAAGGSAASVIFGNNWGTNGATFSEEWRLYMNGADDSLNFNYASNSATAMSISSGGTLTYNFAAIFNESGGNNDFRVESDTNANALHVDAGFGVVGINSNDATTYTTTNSLVINGRDVALVNGVSSGSTSNNIRFWNDTGTAYEIARWVTNIGAGQVNRAEHSFQVNNGAGLREWLSVDYSGNAVFNDDSNDMDFRVESNDDTHMFFVDGSANEIGIRTSSPASTLHVSGRIQTDQFQFSGGDGSATRLGRMFGWSQDNSSSSGATWRKVGVFTMPDASFSSIGILVKTFYPGSNYSAYNIAGQSFTNQCNVTRKTTSVVDNAEIHGPYNPFIQLHRNSVGEWELQSRTVNDNQGVDIQVLVLTSAGGADFAATNGITAGTTGGTVVSADGAAAYTQYITTLASYGGATFNEGGADKDFRVESDGNANMLLVDGSANEVYIGGTSAGSNVIALDAGRIRLDKSGDWNIESGGSSANGNHIRFRLSGADKGSITSDSSGTTYNTTSDLRLKTDIQPIVDGTQKLMSMNPVSHKWIADPDADSVHGFIAQEMQMIVPEAVSGDPDGEEMMSMDYGRITPVLVAALQDAHKKIEALEERLAGLEAQ